MNSETINQNTFWLLKKKVWKNLFTTKLDKPIKFNTRLVVEYFQVGKKTFNCKMFTYEYYQSGYSKNFSFSN